MDQSLLLRVSLEADKPPPAGIAEMAAHLIENSQGVAAVLAYGSCLRDANPEETLIDLYVLTRRLEDVSRHLFARVACRALPPNVYYAEIRHKGKSLRAKCAVMPLADFANRMGQQNRNPYFWARFGQSTRLLYAADEACRRVVLEALAEAACTLVTESRRIAGPEVDEQAYLTQGLNATYGTELRAEKPGRAELIAVSSRDYFADICALTPPQPVQPRGSVLRDWKRRKMIGKALSVARLIKAGFTFEGGADYMAWKIGRHSGEWLVMSSWHRRHPVLTGLMLLPKLLRKGTVR